MFKERNHRGGDSWIDPWRFLNCWKKKIWLVTNKLLIFPFPFQIWIEHIKIQLINNFPSSHALIKTYKIQYFLSLESTKRFSFSCDFSQQQNLQLLHVRSPCHKQNKYFCYTLSKSLSTTPLMKLCQHESWSRKTFSIIKFHKKKRKRNEIKINCCTF